MSSSYPVTTVPGVNSHVLLQAETLGQCWLESLAHILRDGRWSIDDSMGGSYRTRFPDGVRLKEIIGLLVSIRSVSRSDPLIERLADHDRIGLMLRKYRSLEQLPEYPGISYGRLFYDYDGVDQVRWVIDKLRSKRATKSATIAFHPPGTNGEMTCVSLLDFKIRDDTLGMTAVYRSQNVYGSQPGNVLALREVQERVAAAAETPIGDFNLTVLSAHVYEPDLPAAQDVLTRATEFGDLDTLQRLGG